MRLEIIDRSTDEALRRLVDAGLVALTARSKRILPWTDQAEDSLAGLPPLTEEERSKVKDHWRAAARSSRMARLLAEGGFEEETGKPLLEAARSVGRAKAIENRLSEPRDDEDFLKAPWDALWTGELVEMGEYLRNPDQPCAATLTLLKRLTLLDK